MDKRLHWLESFAARGTDGRLYTVNGYEYLARAPDLPTEPDHWEPTGVSAYKLSDGRQVTPLDDGSFAVAGSALRLHRPPMH